ncbi:amidohydrolase [Aestuariibaculum lutulentum]|uniref:Amidohydrolase n=1 Tax=Aestuariibaculum lutulentum TaxID=2920935 RepID=A0ABS9RE21_9FLAO|nr:amidohydrolase [Aestuariibaculum lutulentum]MCH4551191.1 amidohydrolase [Aestuariibaculum lutulentum]
MKKLFTILFVPLLLVSCKEKQQKVTPVAEPYQLRQTIFFGGDILTMEGDSPAYAEAVVEREGKIVFVGLKNEALKTYQGKASEVNLMGKTMVPAFLDGHGHFYNVGFTALAANVLPPPDGSGKDYESIVQTLKTYQNTEDGKYMLSKLGWIIGNGYDDSQLAEKDHPKATDLDKVSTDIPVLIIHQSGHLASINTKGLELMNYNSSTPNPEGGVIRKDNQGNPNGVLEEAAFFKVLIPLLGKMDDEMAAKCIKKGQDEYAKKGYLTAQDGRTTKEQLAALRKAATNEAYYMDVVAYPDITLGTDYISEGEYAPNHRYKNKFRVGGVKLTLDGSPQGKTAWLTKCYHVNPEGRTGCYEGYPIMDDDKAINYVKTAFNNKWQILCHSNGDAAIDQYIKAVDAAEKEFGYPDHRTVLIHGQTLRKDQIPELVRLNIMPSLFPMHTFYWGDWHVESVLGEPRADYISPCRDAIDAGLKITSHHDAPVTFPNSMRVLDATVNRITRSGEILGPDQRISAYEGLKTLTDWAAYQYFEENNKGTITEGKLADFVILDKNPLKIDPLEINTIQVLESIKEGQTVYKMQ